ncbi:Hsp70 family protein [Micromonospora sp. CPCC 206061]|uniref:Hsp70 family protein n=1 Tax=Micromonospora sp. CPCC 206061 TaxID=3122410 RepID=UPI002FF0D9EB
MAGGYRLGIDFGTSSTVAVLAIPDRPAVPLLFDSSPLLSSAVAVPAGPAPSGADRSLLTGGDAERAALADPGAFEANPKRRIDEGVVWLGDREVAVPDLIAGVFARVAAEARRVAGSPPDDVVLTHPVAWGRSRLDVLVDAAARAGLAGVRLVAEPVAAAAYLTAVLGRRVRTGHGLIVYDLGAGTFDVSVVRRTSGGFEVVASGGLDDVGGLDLDAAVVGHVRTLTASATDAWSRLDWPQSSTDQQARHQLWRGARAAKEQLSRHATAPLHVPLVGTDAHLTREEFDKAAREPLGRTVELTLQVLRGSAVPPEQVDGLFLVGGASRVPLVATMLHRALRIAPIATEVPELVVAEGSLHAVVAAAPVPAELVPADPVPDGPAADEPAAVESRSAPRTPAEPRTRQVRIAGAVAVGGLAAAVAAHAAGAVRIDLVATGVGFAALAVGLLLAGAGGRRAWWALLPLTLLLLARPALVDSGDGTNPFAGIVADVYEWRRLEISPVDGLAAILALVAGAVCARRSPLAGWRRHAPLVLGAVAVANVLAYGWDRWQHLAGWPALIPPVTGWLTVVAALGLGVSLATVPRRLLAGPADGPRRPLLRQPRTLVAAGTALVLATAGVVATIQATPAFASRVIDPDGPVAQVRYSPDGKIIATVAATTAWVGPYRVDLWEAATGRRIAAVGTTTSQTEVAFDSASETVFTSSYTDGVHRWRVSTGEHLATLVERGTGQLSLSPDGRTLAIAGTSVTLYDLEKGTASTILDGNDADDDAAAFHPDGKLLAVGSDGDLLLWDLAAGKEVARVSAHQSRYAPQVFSVGFDPAGSRVVTSGSDGVVRVWSLAGDPPALTYLATPGEGSSVFEAWFSPDGRHVAFASGFDRKVRLWSAPDGPTTTFTGHADSTGCVAFAPDRGTLASGSRDGTVRLWRMPAVGVVTREIPYNRSGR